MNQSLNERKYRRFFNKIFLFFYFRKIYSLLATVKMDKVLSAGCGEGYVLAKIVKWFPQADVQGIDRSERALTIARSKLPKLKFETGMVEKLPYADASFSTVICLEVLEHVKFPVQVLVELKRVSKKWLVLSVPREPWFSIGSFLAGRYLKHWGRHPEHFNFWNQKQISELVSSQFSKIKIKSTFFWTIILATK